jgi:hypothetical protein
MSEEMHKTLFFKKIRSYAFNLAYINYMSEEMHKRFWQNKILCISCDIYLIDVRRNA